MKFVVRIERISLLMILDTGLEHAGAVLYQYTYRANGEVVNVWVCDKPNVVLITACIIHIEVLSSNYFHVSDAFQQGVLRMKNIAPNSYDNLHKSVNNNNQRQQKKTMKRTNWNETRIILTCYKDYSINQEKCDRWHLLPVSYRHTWHLWRSMSRHKLHVIEWLLTRIEAVANNCHFVPPTKWSPPWKWSPPPKWPPITTEMTPNHHRNDTYSQLKWSRHKFVEPCLKCTWDFAIFSILRLFMQTRF